MKKTEIINWILNNIPRGFIAERDFKISIYEEKKIVLNVPLYIRDESFDDNGYLLIFSDNKRPTVEEIANIFLMCKLSKVKKGVFIHNSSDIDEIYLSLDGVFVRNIKFSEDLTINKAGEEFLDELFDE